jgi:hypothetical protein
MGALLREGTDYMVVSADDNTFTNNTGKNPQLLKSVCKRLSLAISEAKMLDTAYTMTNAAGARVQGHAKDIVTRLSRDLVNIVSSYGYKSHIWIFRIENSLHGTQDLTTLVTRLTAARNGILNFEKLPADIADADIDTFSARTSLLLATDAVPPAPILVVHSQTDIRFRYPAAFKWIGPDQQGYAEYELDAAVAIFHSDKSDGKRIGHAISCHTCNTDKYIFDSNGVLLHLDWTSGYELEIKYKLHPRVQALYGASNQYIGIDYVIYVRKQSPALTRSASLSLIRSGGACNNTKQQRTHKARRK